MADIIGDISSMLGVNANLATKSTSRKGNTELNMNDFLQLMIVQLTNQTIDDTMDTSEMMNQMLQMQMITAMTNMTEVSVQSYANSLVGKMVTVGLINGNVLEERYTEVMATGTYNGQQVIFCRDGNMYYLNQIMAVGALPDENGSYDYLKPGGSSDKGDSVEESYIYKDDDGNETTVYVGEDGEAGTEDDWYYADVDGDGLDEKVFVGSDGIPGTDKDWYDPDHVHETDDEQDGTQDVPTETEQE